MAQELNPQDIKIQRLTDDFLRALASFEEYGTPEAYEARFNAEKALNAAVVEKRRGRPGPAIVSEES
jgi:hypothetical protein